MSDRLFVSIDLPPSIEKVLVDLDPRIRGVRWVAGNQMHLTLGFFPDVSGDVDLALREELNAIHGPGKRKPAAWKNRLHDERMGKSPT